MPSLPLAASSLLPVFSRRKVRFIVVGAVAAIAQGAPIATQDLDLVIDTAEDNLDAILGACAEIEAVYEDPAGRRLVPDREKLRTFRLHLLHSKHGDIDLLREIGPAQRYADLLARTVELELAGGGVRVLELSAVIEAKRFANRGKDLAVLPVLEETLRLARAKAGPTASTPTEE
jgi:hypothetical protein